jgi:hypothetical protein
MTLAIFPTDPTEMKKMELRSLELIKDCSILSECSADAQTQYYMLKNLTHFRPGAFLYNFESFIDLDIQGISCRVYFGGKVILASASKCDNASYYFAICKNVPKEPKEVLRKVHFDFDSGSDGQSRSKKPYYHLQIGGAFTPRMIDDGVDKSQEQRFNHGLDVPRIFYMPMSLIVAEFNLEVQHPAKRPLLGLKIRDTFSVGC